jgi:hypothetical protein
LLRLAEKWRLGRFPNDRHGLIFFVQERCSGPEVQPGPLHRAIAEAGFRVIVTAWCDELLESALLEAGYRVNRVVRDTQLPYTNEGRRVCRRASLCLTHLLGCVYFHRRSLTRRRFPCLTGQSALSRKRNS